jgi:predicted RNase H-like nuclease
MRSHAVTRALLEQPSPLEDRPYKHREDLLAALLCAWTAALWHRFGFERCQVLGLEPDLQRPAATIIASARPEQRLDRVLAGRP